MIERFLGTKFDRAAARFTKSVTELADVEAENADRAEVNDHRITELEAENQLLLAEKRRASRLRQNIEKLLNSDL